MNLTKGRKLTALITLAVMVVAVVTTACILTVPNLYKDNDVATTSTAAYGMGNVTYTTKNASVAYANLASGSDGADIRVLFPNTIYLDKTESLEDAGYYIAYDLWAKSKNGNGDKVTAFDTLFGYFGGATDVNKPDTSATSTAYMMHTMFPNYQPLSRTNVADNSTISQGIATKNSKRNTTITIEARDTNTTVKIALKGTLSSTYAVADTNKTFTFPSDYPIAYTEYHDWLGWHDLYTGSSFGSGSGEFHNISGFTSPTYKSTVSFNIYVYDKSTLNSKITSFRNEMTSNSTALNSLGAYQRAENFIKNIEDTVLKEREVTQAQINTAVSQIDSYTWQITQPTVSNNVSRVYNADAVANTTFYSSFNSTYHELKITNSAGTQVSEARDVGIYNAQVTIKSGVFSGSRGWSWVNSSGTTVGTGYINCTTNYSITAKSFTASTFNITKPFINADYTFDSSIGFTYGNNDNDKFVESKTSTPNTKTIEFSLDNSSWSSSVSLGKNGSDVKANTVYFRISAPNHNTYTNSFTVTIEKANISILIADFSQYYGATLLTSDDILDQMVSVNMPNILNATNITETKALLKQIISKFVIGSANSPIEFDGVNYVDADSYSIDYVRNSEWNDRINEITFTNNTNRGAYVIKPRPVSVLWTQKENLWYDGVGGKRPTASIQSMIDLGDGFVQDDNNLQLDSVEISSIEGGPALVNGEAINAGTYKASVSITNRNYVVDETSLNNGTFTIKKRPIKVVLEDRERTYAQEMTASEVWKYYIETLFPNNVEVNGKKVYEITLGSEVMDGKDAIASRDEVIDVFTVLLDPNAQYTPDGNYFVVNEEGYDLILSMESSNYEFTSDSQNAKFVVKPVLLDINIQQIDSKIYNGEEQELLLPNNDSVIPLKGYEAEHRELITIEYRASETDEWSSNPVTRKNVGTSMVYYRVTVPNHIVNDGHLSASIVETNLYVDVTGQKSVFTYGDAFPTSADLVEILGIKYYWSTDDAVNDTLKFDLSDKLQFRLLDGTGSEGTLTPDQANAGKYTVSHEFINGESAANYDIQYVSVGEVHKNVNAFTISQKSLYVEWKQSGDNWLEDGLTFSYFNVRPVVRPVAPAEWEGEVNVVAGDTINLAEITLGGSVVGTYDAHTSLSQPINQQNYTIANADQQFEIVKRVVRIYAKDQTASYGNAKTVPLGTALVNPNQAGALWSYATDSLTFASDHYASFKLESEAHTAPDGQYRDVATYPIVVAPIDSATGEIVDNYDVKVVYESTPSGMGGMFEITPANITYSGREFNIDISKESGELGYVTKTQLRDRISTTIGTPLSEFVVEMSDLISSSENKVFDDLTADDLVATQTRTIDDNNVGSYYILIRITHERDNYNTFEAKIPANFWTDWVSVTISSHVEAEYGSEVYSSEKIFDLLEFASITGIVDDNGNNKSLDEAIAELKTYVEFFVGSGDTQTPMTGKNQYGTFSLFMRVVDSSKYSHFRFKAYNGASDTSNIGAYVVGQRVIGIDWGTMDEIYGEHGDGENGGTVSNSHTYDLENVLPEDEGNVRVTITYYSKDANGNLTELNGHSINVGTYVAKVTSVTHPNYKLPEDRELSVEYNITPRELTIAINNREITYGDADATRNNINEFLNRVASGIQLFTIKSGSFAYNEDWDDVFSLKLGAYNLASNLNYLTANEGDSSLVYTIVEDLLGNENYNIDFESQGNLTVKKANLTFDRAQIQSKRYDGTPISVEPNILYYTLRGDGNDAFKDSVVASYKIFGDATSQYDEHMTITNAGTYYIGIKIEAPNHNVYETTSAVNFEIAKARVEINMTSTQKVYGDTLADLLAKDGTSSSGNDELDFSDWLIRHCNITFKTYTMVNGVADYYTVQGVENDIKFKVIKRGTGNGDALTVGLNDVGLYRVYHIVDYDLSNYEIDYYHDPIYGDNADDTVKCNYGAYEIIKREAEITWTATGAVEGSDGKKFEYTGSNVGLNATITLVNGSSVNCYIDYEMIESIADKDRASATSVGKWIARVSDGGGFTLTTYTTNYEFTNNAYEFEIVPRKVTVTINNVSAVYGTSRTQVGGELDSTQYTCDVDMSGLIALYLDDVDTDRTYYGVGEYHIYGRCESTNYEVTFKGQDSNNRYAILTIIEADAPTVSVVRPDPVAYNGRPYSVNIKEILKENPSYTFAGDMTLDDATILYRQEDGTYSEQLPVINGIAESGVAVYYRIQLANHKEATSDLNMTITVNKATLYINMSSGASSVYGDDLLTSDELYDKAHIVLDAGSSITGIDLKDYITFSVDVDDDVVAKQYSLKYEFIDAENEDYFNIIINASNVYEVKPREVVVKWTSQTFVYDGETHEVTATLEGVINGDVVNALYSGNTGIDADNYTAQVISIDNSNYTLGASASFNWSISPKAVTVEWTAGDFTYDGQEHLVAAPTVVSGLVGQDTCSIKVSGAKVHAGTHTATAESLNTNYTVSNSTYDFVIKQAVVTIVWDETPLIYNGSSQVPKAIVSSGLINDDKCDVVVSGGQVNAGKNYVATATAGNQDYKIEENVTTTFEITAKAITFTWSNTTLNYNKQQQVPNAVAVGTVGDDKVEFIIEIVEGQDQGIHVGNYTAIVTGVKANDNYRVDTENQTSMSTPYRIDPGVNFFHSELSLPSTVEQLPWSGEDKPTAEFGDVVVKYYMDEARTQEITDITNAKEGTYWVVVSVAEHTDYNGLEQVFKVELQSGFNIVVVVVGAVLSIVLLAGALVVVQVANKKKQ